MKTVTPLPQDIVKIDGKKIIYKDGSFTAIMITDEEGVCRLTEASAPRAMPQGSGVLLSDYQDDVSPN